MWEKVKGAFNIWNVVRDISPNSLRREVSLPVRLFVVASEAEFGRLLDKLGTSSAAHIKRGDPIPSGDGVIIVDAARLLDLTSLEFESALAKIAIRHSDRRIALAAAIPCFREAVVNQISHDRAFENAKYAALSALPGVVPLTDWLMPASAAADLWVLTKNQLTLLLEVAACYGRPPDVKARIKELLPVVGGAFGWRAIARELIGLVPGGVGIVVKAGVAYAGTYSVGRAAAHYYAGNGLAMTKKQLSQVFRSAFNDAVTRLKRVLPRK